MWNASREWEWNKRNKRNGTCRVDAISPPCKHKLYICGNVCVSFFLFHFNRIGFCGGCWTMQCSTFDKFNFLHKWLPTIKPLNRWFSPRTAWYNHSNYTTFIYVWNYPSRFQYILHAHTYALWRLLLFFFQIFAFKCAEKEPHIRILPSKKENENRRGLSVK